MPGVAHFGPLVTQVDVDEAVIATLRKYVPRYITQYTEEKGLDYTLRAPRMEAYANTLEDDEFPDHSLPAVIVTTASTVGAPEKDGDGFYYAAYRVIISSVLQGRLPKETRRNAALLEAIVKKVLVDHPDLDGFSGEVKWTASNVSPVADTTGAGRYLAAGITEMLVYVDHVMQAGVGPYEGPDPTYPPKDPDDPTPYDPLVEVESVTVTVGSLGLNSQPGDGG